LKSLMKFGSISLVLAITSLAQAQPHPSVGGLIDGEFYPARIANNRPNAHPSRCCRFESLAIHCLGLGSALRHSAGKDVSRVTDINSVELNR
jgi:hypothetical protein